MKQAQSAVDAHEVDVRRHWLVRWFAYPAIMTAGMVLYAASVRAGIGAQAASFLSVTAGALCIVALERWIPYRREWHGAASELRTDFAYLLLVQLALPAALAVTFAFSTRLGGQAPAELWPHAWPVAAQFGLLLIAADGLRYGLHVAAHRWAPLWRLHAVHHAPAKLYVLNVGRFHPLERTLQYVAETLPFAVLGARPEVLASYVVFHSLHGFFQHANVDIRLGPLNYLVSGPELHRWHHSRVPGESNANYSNHLALWDLLFGTYVLPAGSEVAALGLVTRRYPATFAEQLRAPFSGSLDQVEGPVLGWRDIVLNALLRLRMALAHWQAWRPLVAAARRPREAQLAVLRHIVRRNRTTQFGRRHGFDAIGGVDDFRRRVPVQTYDSLRPYIDAEERSVTRCLTADPPVLYAQTSGTTGAPRYFPISRRALQWHRHNQNLFAYVQYRAVAGAYAGRILAIVSPAHEGLLPSGVPFGSVSGALYRAMPRVARAKYVVPPEVFEIADYELRYLLILRLALAEPNLTAMASANPSTFLKLLSTLRDNRARLLADLERGGFSRLHELPGQVRRAVEPRLRCDRTRAGALRHALMGAPVSFADVWPHLRLVSTWTGGSCGIALGRVRALLPPAARVVDLGYLASEFRGSITIDAASNAGLPTLQENFFEFVEKESWEHEDARFRLLDELEVGRDYYVFVTTRTGLYRYFINDIVRVTGRFHATPTIAFVQKGKGVTNVTGEKLYEGQVLEAVHAAEVEVGGSSRFFVMLADVAHARYRLLIERDACFAPEADRFAARVDRALCERNIEYRVKRASGRLAPLQVQLMREGFAEAYHVWCVHNGQREGQFKTIALQYAADFRFDSVAWSVDPLLAVHAAARTDPALSPDRSQP